MDIHFESALAIAEKIHSGETTSVAVTTEMLARISQLDGRLKSYVTVMTESALNDARRADEELSRGNKRSPLHGVPIAVKDLLDTKGTLTTYGMKINYDHVPDKDAGVVHKLKAAGCVILGKLKLTEGAYARHHPEVEVPINPWDENCWTGVSSSGSGVATAAGLCFASIGSDTGGSIRFPSAANGLVGLKPTWGRVSRSGAMALAYTLDHMGPITRSVKDAAAMLEIIAGRDEDDPTSSFLAVDQYLAAAGGNLKGLTIGIDWSYCTNDVDPELTEAVKNALGLLMELGARSEDVHIPFEAVTAGWPITCGVETAHAHRETYPSRKDEYGAIGDLIEMGLSLPASAYLEQEITRRAFKASLNVLFETVDLLICPSMPFTANFREGSAESDALEQALDVTLKFAAPYDFSGNPTLSIPWYIGSRGLPLSVQLIARDFEENTLIKAGYALEQAGGHHANYPPV
jgi:amidase